MDAVEVAHRHLRSALEFAVLMAQEGQKFKPPMKSPPGLKKYMKMQRIPTGSLPAIRRLVERAPEFRERIAVGAVPELVDPIGKLWLERPAGWQADLVELAQAAEVEQDHADAAAALKRAERRREAAEQATVRARAEIVVLQEQLDERAAQLDDARADVAKLGESVEEMRLELIDTRTELRHARDRERGAQEKAERAEATCREALTARGEAEGVRDDALADRALVSAERSELARIAAAADALAAQLAAMSSPPASSGERVVASRKALPLPGGVLGDSTAAGEHLLRSGATVLVDGYNVAKLGWPKLDLEGQRVVLLDAMENLVRRYGCDLTVVFDGADVIGATANRRRVLRVVYSPGGVIADDVIRDEVARLPATRHVVVVTNDLEIVRDVRSSGANTMSSDQLLALTR